MADLTTNPRASVQNQDDGVLDASITSAATSATISPLTKWVNGAQVTGGFDSTKGFVKIIDSTGRYEYASFNGKSVDSNYITTISNMRRGLSPSTSSYTAGTGSAWDANTRIYVCDYAEMWQDMVDTNNTQTITGDKSFSGLLASTSRFRLNVFADATARDAVFTSPTNGDKCYVTGVGEQVYSGGVWVTINASSTSFAADHAAGSLDVASGTEIGAGTAVDATSGAINVIPVSQTVKTSSGAGDVNKLPVLDANGRLADGFLGTGTASSANFLRGDRAWTSILQDTNYGDGSSGTPTWTSGATLDPTSVFQYVTATLPVSQTLAVSSSNTPLRIFATGSVIINGTISLSGKGGPFGAGKTGSFGNGTSGTDGYGVSSGFATGGGGGGGGVNGGTSGGGGGSGASFVTAGTVGIAGSGGTAGAAGSAGALMSTTLQMYLAAAQRFAACGGGGGGGGRAGGTADGGDGGNGGGALIMFIGGNLTLGASSTITVAGSNGSNGGNGGANPGAGGGGAGSGGSVFIIVQGSITNSGVTLTVSGGTKGTGGTGTSAGGNGADGVSGKVFIYSISTGTLVTA